MERAASRMSAATSSEAIHRLMPAPIWAGVFGMTRTTRTLKANRSWMKLVGIPAAIEKAGGSIKFLGRKTEDAGVEQKNA